MPTRDRPAAIGCLSDALLAQVFRGEATGADLDAAARHLDACAVCLGRLEALGPIDGRTRRAMWASGSEPEVLKALMHRLREAAAPSPDTIEDAGDTDVDLLGPPLAPGSIGSLAGYDVLERVASGGMGVVYKGFDRALNRVVAIKVLARARAASDAARARFLREARAAAAVAHEHVVPIHAVGEDHGLPYLVMQFVHGRSLQSRIDEGRLALPEMLRIGSQTAAGLAAAHAQGIVHRDIKPGNILLENGVERVKVTDFGLARVVDEPSSTHFGMLVGTPEYMSPEQARGEPGDERSDLFSLGCVLYAMATGHSPFAGGTVLVTLRRVCDETPAAVQKMNPALPAWFGKLVACLLDKDPEQRYPNAQAVAEDLSAALAELQSGRVPHIPSCRHPGIRSRRAGWLRLVAMGTLLGLVLVPASRFWSPPPRAAVRPELTCLILRSDGRAAGIWTNLAHAIAAAESGDTIEIRADGIIRVPPLLLGDKALTLRAAAGSHPVLVRKLGFGPLLTTSAELSLEGLEFRPFDYEADPVTPSIFGTFLDAAQRPVSRGTKSDALVHARGPKVWIAHCRLVGAVPEGGISPLLVENAAEVTIVNSEFYAVAETAIRWRFRSDPSSPATAAVMTVSNCVALSRGLITIEDKRAVPRRIELQRNTVIALMLLDAVGACRFETRATGNVFNAYRRSTFRIDSSRTEVEHSWHGATNLFRDPSTLQQTHPQALADREEIERHIATVETNSLVVEMQLAREIQARGISDRAVRATDFTLEPRVAERAAAAFGAAGRVGAHLEAVGPGAAYAASRSSSLLR